MAINGSVAWDAQVSAEYKTALYVLEIIQYQGTVNTSGLNVTRTQGNDFLGTWPGKALIIDDGAYTVNVVTDGSHLSVLTSPGSHTGLQYEFPLLVLSTFLPTAIVAPPVSMLPYLQIPDGAGQSVTEVDGHSSISDLSATTIDPTGQVKLAVKDGVIGLLARLRVGFPNLNYSEFVTMFTGTIIDTGYTADGMVTFSITDVQKSIVDQVWLNGGPGHQGTVSTSGTTVTLMTGDEFVTDGSWNGLTIYLDAALDPFIIESVTDFENLIVSTSAGSNDAIAYIVPDDNVPEFNCFKDDQNSVSDNNPRYLFGHPLDILLCVMQNELGIGQDPALPPPLEDTADGTDGTMDAVFKPNVDWLFYIPNVASWQADTNYAVGSLILDPSGHYQQVTVAGLSDSVEPTWNDAGGTTTDNTITWQDEGLENPTLINPNQYIDIDGVLALRDGQFSMEQMYFKLTMAVSGKTWVEDQILKPLGLYWIARSDGRLALKTMKRPEVITTTSVTNSQIMGIPTISRYPIINYVTIRAQVDNEKRETAARTYAFAETFTQRGSINTYKQQYQTSIESDGLRSTLGVAARAFLTINQIFNRHASGTPQYDFDAFFSTLRIELGDYILLTHPLLFDSFTGLMGVTNVLCEVVNQTPHYPDEYMSYSVIDTRFINIPPKAYLIAPNGTPAWTGASPTEKSTYMFVCQDDGKFSNGDTALNVIF